MLAGHLPIALRDRLGTDGVCGLLDVLDREKEEWTEEVITTTEDRFERRLVEVGSSVRPDLEQFRQETRDSLAAQTRERQEGEATLRQMIHDARVDTLKVLQDVRVELHQGFADVREGSVTQRFELIKWMLVFWVGQVVAMAGLIGMMLRGAN